MEEAFNRATNILHTWSSDGSESIRIASSDAQLVEARLDPVGNLHFKMRGRSPQGEQESDRAAWILVERLNQYGGNWSPPRRPDGPERGTDFVARDGDEELEIQITRAFSDRSVWRELSRASEVERAFQIDGAVDQLWEAIQAKANDIAMSARPSLVLGLDTSFPAVFAPVGLMIAFKKRHAAHVQSLGFKSVWLIGPTAALTWRIDEPFPEGQPIRIGF